ncbi:hypothetical protein RI367_000657 [Sorochytrium milnesiophthora]
MKPLIYMDDPPTVEQISRPELLAVMVVSLVLSLAMGIMSLRHSYRSPTLFNAATNVLPICFLVNDLFYFVCLVGQGQPTPFQFEMVRGTSSIIFSAHCAGLSIVRFGLFGNSIAKWFTPFIRRVLLIINYGIMTAAMVFFVVSYAQFPNKADSRRRPVMTMFMAWCLTVDMAIAVLILRLVTRMKQSVSSSSSNGQIRAVIAKVVLALCSMIACALLGVVGYNMFSNAFGDCVSATFARVYVASAMLEWAFVVGIVRYKAGGGLTTSATKPTRYGTGSGSGGAGAVGGVSQSSKRHVAGGQGYGSSFAPDRVSYVPSRMSVAKPAVRTIPRGALISPPVSQAQAANDPLSVISSYAEGSDDETVVDMPHNQQQAYRLPSITYPPSLRLSVAAQVASPTETHFPTVGRPSTMDRSEHHQYRPSPSLPRNVDSVTSYPYTDAPSTATGTTSDVLNDQSLVRQKLEYLVQTYNMQSYAPASVRQQTPVSQISQTATSLSGGQARSDQYAPPSPSYHPSGRY